MKRADLAMRPPEDVGYVRPPPDECEEYTFTLDPSGGDMTVERVKIRMVTHVPTWGLAEFAVIQETRSRGGWCIVAMADSSHAEEVHVHRYGRVAGERVGEPEQLMPIADMGDVGDGYDRAYQVIVDAWEANKRRWSHA
ncbi:MAG: hypothetical protein M3O70_19995 [Actinomycetota bacterium]|nr:hypothetical protein [Actinomycetota bacterium]